MADALLERLAETEVTGTPAQPSRECAKAGIRLPASTIRGWIHKGKLQTDPNGRVSLSRLVPVCVQLVVAGLVTMIFRV